MRVVAIDPGGTTGIVGVDLPRAWREVGAIRSVQSCLDSDGQHGRIEQLQAHDDSEMTWKIMEWIGYLEPDVVVVEDFVLYVWKKLSADREMLSPAAINANLRFMWWLAKHNDDLWGADVELPKLVFQMPAEKDQITDKQLRRWKLWRTPTQSGGPHAMDALRHLLVYLKKERSK